MLNLIQMAERYSTCFMHVLCSKNERHARSETAAQNIGSIRAWTTFEGSALNMGNGGG